MSSSLSEFSNNLASGLGPLLALECTTTEDYIIVATAPIGIITALVSAIRICGGAYLRAFVGRAQEGAAATEAEQCTSKGRDVCELFTRGGITRSLGKPSILELVHLQPAPYLKRHGDGRWSKRTGDTRIRQRKGLGNWLNRVQSHLKDPEGDALLKAEENGPTRGD
ncbi:hypothetical protein N657DRAFT_632636 [Parathielavia appendiculata]|uniref:Uncharacterized protein n=1 Tax=Parathielavia appendiculata TaxID=2587402 RepID=A0AAN6U5Z2_9PEZI|nr:hypothetical protein N657DRAFT_632636 [Parathielavia appendiculata]